MAKLFKNHIFLFARAPPPMCLAFSVFLDYLLRVDLLKSTWTDDMASLLPIDKSQFKKLYVLIYMTTNDL